MNMQVPRQKGDDSILSTPIFLEIFSNHAVNIFCHYLM